MQDADAVGCDRLAMVGRGVADVAGEVPVGVVLSGLSHVAVAGHFGDHRRRCDGGAAGVAADDRLVLDRAAGAEPEAVAEALGPGDGHPRQAVAERVQVRDVKSTAVDAAGAAGRDHDPRCRCQDGRVEAFAVLLGLALGVIETRERLADLRGQAAVVEEYASSDERARERSPPGLVGARDEAVSESLIEAEQPGGSTAVGTALGPAPSLDPLRGGGGLLRTRRCRSGRGASRWRRPRR